ncbi:MAG: peptidoglycan/xylan/chitin deacetylase (PgdA/CDA1 family), partial [Nonlabens sp.]
MYLVKTPSFIQKSFPNFLWRQATEEKTLYLTFDDGPIPEVTPWVLDQLDQYQAKATFFCVGDNVEKHPHIFAELTQRGHRVGNHTQQHLSGWATETSKYMANVEQCAAKVDSDLFRPPYGRLRPKQAKLLRQKYTVVMWDVLSGDFDVN